MYAAAIAERSASNIARGSVSGGSLENVAKDMVGLDQAKALNAASVQVVRAGSDMDKAILDILA
jgi:hypothetical protein